MKFKSAVVTEGSGKLGGSVFSRNAFGQYIRPYRMPINPKTNAQEIARAALSDGAKAWATLTEQDRAAWVEYAKTVKYKDALGNTYSPTGQNAFVGAFALRTDMDGTAPDPASLVPVYTRVPGSVGITSAAASNPNILVLGADLQLDPMESVVAGTRVRFRVYNLTGLSNPSGSRSLLARVVEVPTGTPLAFDLQAVSVNLPNSYEPGTYSVKVDAILQQPDGRSSILTQQVLTVTIV
jgi:hypothetical protein